jgi:hypothetical protein
MVVAIFGDIRVWLEIITIFLFSQFFDFSGDIGAVNTGDTSKRRLV